MTDKRAEEQIADAAALPIALKDVIADERLYHAVIEHYLEELEGSPCVPVVRGGYRALTVLRKPHSLAEAKTIVDSGGA